MIAYIPSKTLKLYGNLGTTYIELTLKKKLYKG